MFTPQRRQLAAITACLLDEDAQQYFGYGEGRLSQLRESVRRLRRFDPRPTQYHEGGVIFGVEIDGYDGIVAAAFAQFDDEGVPIGGAAVRADCRGQGLGTEAFALTIDVFVHHFGYRRLSASTLTNNARARALATRLGGQIVEVDVPRTLDDGRAVTEMRLELITPDAVRRCAHPTLLVP